jgi:signal transduction histidine kinase/CheY-like chemotaxis protein
VNIHPVNAADTQAMLATARQCLQRGELLPESSVEALLQRIEGLQRDNDRLRHFLEVDGDWHWEVDAALNVSVPDERFAEMRGVRPESLVGQAGGAAMGLLKNSWDFWKDCAIRERHEPFHNTEFATVNAADEPLHISVSGVPTADEQGRFSGYLCVGRNITAEKDARLKVDVINRGFREVVQAMNDGFALFDADDRLVAFNEAYRQLNTHSADLLDSQPTFDEISGRARELGQVSAAAHGTSQWFTDRKAAHRQGSFSDEIHLGDGRTMWVREHLTSEGGVVSTWTDVTALREADDARTILDHRNQMIIQAIHGLDEAFALWDEGDGLVFRNEKSREGAVGANHQPGTLFETSLRAIAAGGGVVESRGREEAWIAEWLEHFRNPARPIEEERSGRILQIRMYKFGGGTASVARDITEQRQAERHARRTQRHETVSRLVAGVAHDFNNLLAIILGHAQLGLTIQADGDAVLRRFEEIRDAGERGAKVVQQLMTFVRGDEAAATSVAVGEVIRETVGLLRSTLPSTVELSVGVPGEFAIRFDPAQLQQVLLNLCLNSRDAICGKGTIRVSVTDLPWRGQCSSCGAVLDGLYVEVAVLDNGAGMSEEILARAFDPFFTTKDVGQGSGMGLSMVHGLIHQHDGHLHVSSHPGVGTTFRLLFPAQAAEHEPPDEVVADAGLIASVADVTRGHIVLVDDEPYIVGVLGELFRWRGYRVTTFTDSLTALVMLLDESIRVDLLITDLTMPGMSGLELAEKAVGHGGNFPVILCSGSDIAVDTPTQQRLRIVAALAKPLDAGALVQLADELLTSPPEEAL